MIDFRHTICISWMMNIRYKKSKNIASYQCNFNTLNKLNVTVIKWHLQAKSLSHRKRKKRWLWRHVLTITQLYQIVWNHCLEHGSTWVYRLFTTETLHFLAFCFSLSGFTLIWILLPWYGLIWHLSQSLVLGWRITCSFNVTWCWLLQQFLH